MLNSILLIVELHDDYIEIGSLTSRPTICSLAVNIEEIAGELNQLIRIHYNYKPDKTIHWPLILSHGPKIMFKHVLNI
jgi:hypothetical protein